MEKFGKKEEIRRQVHVERIKVGFICVGNSCRSQMAEGFARYYGNDVIDVYSAGTNPAFEVSSNAVVVMQEKGVDISSQYPKYIGEIPSDLDLVITMGCNVKCPYIPSRYQVDWELEDPVGMPLEKFREVRDKIERKVKALVSAIKSSQSIEEALEKIGSSK
ncbi:MAG: arsenate reductase ArsC [Actinobacteria bacterium]|nr:arsenate reductase ArsC [Actinomycetota bacterium]